MNEGILISVMAAGTLLLRALPFLAFRDKTPKYISYLGKVLPSAVIGMLVIYCLKDVSIITATHGIPELIAAIVVVVLQIWKRNSLVSILGGTVIYMLLVQAIFIR